MAKRQRIKVPSAPQVQRKWLEKSIVGLERHLASLRNQLRADEERAAQKYGRELAEAEETARYFRDAMEPATQGQVATAIRSVRQLVEELEGQLAHLHYDLVALRAHLDIPNPGCAPAEEHTEPEAARGLSIVPPAARESSSACGTDDGAASVPPAAPVARSSPSAARERRVPLTEEEENHVRLGAAASAEGEA